MRGKSLSILSALAVVAFASTVAARRNRTRASRSGSSCVHTGTGIDILARTLGQKMGDDWKIAVPVDNRPGASGNIGTEAAAKSPPDGYTLLMTAATIVQNRSLFKTAPYDPIADFAPIAPLAIGRLALVNASVGEREDREGIHRACAGQSGEDELRVARKRNTASPRDGIVQDNDRHQRRACPVQGHRGRGAGSPGRPDPGDVPARTRRVASRGGRKLNMLAAGGTQRASATPNVPSLAEAGGRAPRSTPISGTDSMHRRARRRTSSRSLTAK